MTNLIQFVLYMEINAGNRSKTMRVGKCPQCKEELVYLQDRSIKWCLHCGYEDRT